MIYLFLIAVFISILTTFLICSHYYENKEKSISVEDRDVLFGVIVNIIKYTTYNTLLFNYSIDQNDDKRSIFTKYINTIIQSREHRIRINNATILKLLNDVIFIDYVKRYFGIKFLSKKNKQLIIDFIADWIEKFLLYILRDINLRKELIIKSVYNDDTLQPLARETKAKEEIDKMNISYELTIRDFVDKYNNLEPFSTIYVKRYNELGE